MTINGPDDISKTFCIMPWVGIATDASGGIRPCCWMPSITAEDKFAGAAKDYKDSEYLKTVKQTFLDGEFPSSCSRCKSEEGAGIKSKRHRQNQNYRSFIPKYEEDNGWQIVDLRLSNLCNLGCVMCNPKSSSFIKAEVEADYEGATDNYRSTYDAIVDLDLLNPYSDEDIDYLVEGVVPGTTLYFTGGEPSLIKKVFRFLEAVEKKGLSEKVNIQFNSNFVVIHEKWMTLLSRFTGLMMPSLDGVGARAEYIRYPCKWDEVSTNISAFVQSCPQFRVDLSPSVSIVSLFGLPDLFAWARSIPGVTISLKNRLIKPDYFDMCNLPDDKKASAQAMLDDLLASGLPSATEADEIKDVKKHLAKPSNAPFAKTIETLDKFDRIRGTDWRQALPELT
jgi:hypothetical protein